MALASVYRERDFAKIQSLDVEADMEEVSASCGHFSFTLMEFGEQLKDLLQILDELKLECDERPQGLTWNWLKFWHAFKNPEPDYSNNGKSTEEIKLAQITDKGYRIFKSGTYELNPSSSQERASIAGKWLHR